MSELEEYWSKRYKEGMTGWDLEEPSRPIVKYFEQVEDKTVKILIPGAGNAYEASYLFDQGFKNINVLDVSPIPLASIKKRSPEFPDQQLIEADFFSFQGAFDIIIEQTFFCSFPPAQETRQHYANKMYDLLNPNGKLVGLWFDFPLKGDMVKRPFGGTEEEYLSYLSPLFEVCTFERCYNSVDSRQDKELFGIFKKSN